MSLRVAADGTAPPVEITCDGRRIAALPGDSVAAALVAAGFLALRAGKAGEPRGVFCGMGVCQECLVAIDGVPGSRACMTTVRAGMVIESQPHAPVYAIPREAPDRTAPRTEIRPDVLVIGAGAAGLSAARAAAEAGASVTVLDERPEPGGQYYKQRANAQAAAARDRQMEDGAALIRAAHAAGAAILSRATAWGAFRLDGAGVEVAAEIGGESALFHPGSVVLATGAYERGVPVPGWTLPGVMTTGAAQTLLRAYGVLPGRRVLLAGNGPLNLEVAAELSAAGADVVAVAEAGAPFRAWPALARVARASPDLACDGAGYLARMWRARVPVMAAHVLLSVAGEGQASEAVLAPVGADGRPRAGDARQFAVDAVCMGYGFLPQNELARALGCCHVWDAALGHLATVRDASMATTVPGVYVAGDSGGLLGARAAAAQGTVAGFAAARATGCTISPALAADEARARRALARARAFQAALWEAFRAPPLGMAFAAPETAVCRCEDVSRGAIEAALAAGAHDVGAVKRATRAGMGRCQGRYCGPLIADALAARAGRAPDEATGFLARPPAKPVPLGVVARVEAE